MPTIDAIYKNAETEYNRYLQEYNGTLSKSQKLAIYKKSAESLKVLAYGEFLINGNVDGFYNYLYTLAKNHLSILRDLNDNIADPYVSASNLDGIYSAIICNETSLLCELLQRSSTKIIAPEYDDEFLIASQLIHILKAHYIPPSDFQFDYESSFSAVEDYLGEEPLITPLFKSILDKDQEKYAESFVNWHSEVCTNVSEKQSASSAEYSFGVTRYIHLQGLALLAFGRAMGLILEDEFELIPQMILSSTPDRVVNAAPFLCEP